ncbi:MAG: hypothetical protein KDD70_06135 [Bdellovibrionales bacterium]|nr:hypothetical protein [Bdellovibrionales bacterium]
MIEHKPKLSNADSTRASDSTVHEGMTVLREVRFSKELHDRRKGYLAFEALTHLAEGLCRHFELKDHDSATDLASDVLRKVAGVGTKQLEFDEAKFGRRTPKSQGCLPYFSTCLYNGAHRMRIRQDNQRTEPLNPHSRARPFSTPSTLELIVAKEDRRALERGLGDKHLTQEMILSLLSERQSSLGSMAKRLKLDISGPIQRIFEYYDQDYFRTFESLRLVVEESFSQLTKQQQIYFQETFKAKGGDLRRYLKAMHKAGFSTKAESLATYGHRARSSLVTKVHKALLEEESCAQNQQEFEVKAKDILRDIREAVRKSAKTQR